MTYLLGIDIGGTKIEAALLSFSLHQGLKLITKKRTPTLRDQGYGPVLSRIVTLCQEVTKNLPQKVLSLSGIGIGLPGTIDPSTQKMLNGNTSLFVGNSLTQDLKNQLKIKIPMQIENDANCFTLAEVFAGAGLHFEKETGISPEKHLGIGLILGTGVGGGLVYEEKLLHGRKGGALEIGHSVLSSREKGRNCFCGLKGCVESYLCGPALIKEYQKYHPEAQEIKGEDIFSQSQKGDLNSLKVVTEYKKNLAHFLVNLTNIFDPDYFVLGGGVSQQTILYQGLEEIIKTSSFVPESSPRVYQHVLGDSAGVFGAALIIKDSLFQEKIKVQLSL
jgi:fructokinase